MGKVFVSWEPSEGFRANGYVLQRSESGKNQFKDIAVYREYLLNNYTDRDVENGVSYDYRVAAVNQRGQSGFSAVAQAVPTACADLPEGWSCTLTGGLRNTDSCFAQGGFASCAKNTFVLRGKSSRQAKDGDVLPFIYRKVSGNFTLIARLQEREGPVNEMGLMARAGLEAASDAVTLTLGGRFTRAWGWNRSAGRFHNVPGNVYTWLPSYYKLVRVDDVFYAYESADGETWFFVHAERMQMPAEIYVGLTASFGGKEHTGVAGFDHVLLR